MGGVARCTAAVLVLVGMPAGTAAQAAMPSLTTYAVLGLDDVSLGARIRVGAGDVGANRGSVRLGAAARVVGTVAADTVRLARGARTGGLVCNLLIASGSQSCTTLAQPVVDLAALHLLQVVPGAAEVRVPAQAATAPLGPGAYGNVRIGARGRLVLVGGDYAVRSLVVGARGRLSCAAPCRIAVLERVVLEPHAMLGPATGLDARAVRLDVEGRAARLSVVARPRTALAANVYAPQGEIRLGARGRYEGAFVGRAVTVGRAARLTGANAFVAR
jgi:hypothetical protein